MGDYIPWGDVLKNVYQSARSNVFPLNTSILGQAMGNAIGGLGNLIQQQQQVGQYQFAKPPVIVRDITKDTVTVKQNWLDSKIDRVRLLGREWLSGSRLVVKEVVEAKKASNRGFFPPSTGTSKEIPWEGTTNGSTVYTKRLRNGDQVYVYPKPEDFFPDRYDAKAHSEMY